MSRLRPNLSLYWFIRIAFFGLALGFTMSSGFAQTEVDSLVPITVENDSQAIDIRLQIADRNRISGNYDIAILNANEALRIAQKLRWPYAEARAYNSLAYIKMYSTEYDAALRFALSALDIAEANNDRYNMGYAYLYIGYVHNSLGEHEIGKDYTIKSLQIRKELCDAEELGWSYTYLANYYGSQGQLDSALANHQKALKVRKTSKAKRSIADSYLLIGGVYFRMGNTDEAMKQSRLALSEYIELNDHKRLGETYRQMAEIHFENQNLDSAEAFLTKALKEAKAASAFDNIVLIFEKLTDLKEQQGEYHEALDYLRQYNSVRDSIASMKVLAESSKMMLKYKIDKEKRIEELIRENERMEQQIITYSAVLGALFLIIFLGFVISRLKLSRRQNAEIERQKIELEKTHQTLQVQHTEIQDSIAYAKRIQEAILPSKTILNRHLPNGFVFYQPKDVVAGDFYWIYPPQTEGDPLFVAAADCTGHGVPGAMVSVVCHNALNRAVREFELKNPGEILSKTRELVISEFEKSDERVQDGMDIALCSIQGTSVAYAGAYNPLWIIRKDGTAPKEVEQIKAHKQAIGLVEKPRPFPTHTVDLKAGDLIYLFSDGFADQFGGDKGKKLKTINFKRLLSEIHHMSMEEQHQYIKSFFRNWKRSYEQIDDVCVIGIRL